MEFNRCLSCMETVSTYPCPHCGYDPGAESAFPYALQPGTILNGKYVVGTVLGQGGFGITYIGWDLALESKVAIKEYFPSAQVSRTQTSGALQWYNTEAGRTARDSGREMFLKEARKMARVSRIPQVVRVLDLFQQNNTAYIVMDFVEGENLKNRLKKTGPLPWDQARDIFLPAIDAMERVHKAGLVHRDLSPDNLMLTPDGSVRILDLGAAKDLNINTGASSMQVAKGGFSPLEQYTQRGGSGPWTDVYAMAATMYFTFTGVLPLPSVDRLAKDTLRWDLPQLAALPGNVRTALQKAMVISPEARTQSMAEFASQLTAPSPVAAQPRQPVRKARSDESTKTKTAPEPKVAPKKEPTAKGKDVPGDTAASKEPEHSGGSSGKARKRLPIIAAVLTLLVVAGGILIWNMKNAPAGSVESEKKPAQIQESSSPTESNTTQETSASPTSGKPEAADETPAEKYAAVEALAQNGETARAAMAFYALGDYQDARERSFALWDTVAVRDTISAGIENTVAVKADGTVVAVGLNDHGQCDVSDWTDIIAISSGCNHTVGLKADGTVVAVGDNSNGQCNVTGWKDIVAVSSRQYHTVGLKADGTVVATGWNTCGQCDVSGWTDIVAISAGRSHTVGLKADGTVVAVGLNNDGQCDVSSWTDIVAISAGFLHTVGLKANGTVVAVGWNDDGQCNVDSWTDIVAISTGSSHTVGLKADGTVVAVGSNGSRQCDVSSWTDIVAISTGSSHTIGLKADGTAVAIGSDSYGQCNVSDWKDIKLPKSYTSVKPEEVDETPAEKYAAAEALAQNGETARAAMAFYALGDYQDARERSFTLWDTVAVRDTISAGYWKVLGLREDGTVVATGANVDGSCDVDGWSDIISVSAKGNSHTVGLRADGTVIAAGYPYVGQCDVGDWTDIVSVVAGGNHTVGLRADGTVVATGDNGARQCEVSDWTDIVAISASEGHTVGLKIDGTVVATGRNAYGQCDTHDWTDIVAISAEYAHTVGLKADGTVVAIGNNSSGECDVAQWKNITAISAGICHTVGLRADGTVVATGLNRDNVCDVSNWTDIVAVSTCSYHTAGLKANGTVVVVGSQDGINPDGTLAAPGSKDAYYVDTSTWTSIRLP